MAETATSRDAEDAAGAARAARRQARPTTTTKRREPYFFDYVKEQLIEHYGVGRRAHGRAEGLHDDRPEAAGGRRARRSTASYADPSDPSSAIVAIDPRNGYIRAMASSGTLQRAASSTSPPRATASPARRSRRSC